MRLLSPDDACRAVTVDRAKYTGTCLDVADPAHVRQLRAAGYTVGHTAGAPTRGGGHDCAQCGFRSFFKSCSRCRDTTQEGRAA